MAEAQYDDQGYYDESGNYVYWEQVGYYDENGEFQYYDFSQTAGSCCASILLCLDGSFSATATDPLALASQRCQRKLHRRRPRQSCLQSPMLRRRLPHLCVPWTRRLLLLPQLHPATTIAPPCPPPLSLYQPTASLRTLRLPPLR